MHDFDSEKYFLTNLSESSGDKPSKFAFYKEIAGMKIQLS